MNDKIFDEQLGYIDRETVNAPIPADYRHTLMQMIAEPPLKPRTIDRLPLKTRKKLLAQRIAENERNKRVR